MLENKENLKDLINQLDELRLHKDKAMECLTSIQLLAFDSNNSRTKIPSISDELDNLHKQLDSLSNSISVIENELQ